MAKLKPRLRPSRRPTTTALSAALNDEEDDQNPAAASTATSAVKRQQDDDLSTLPPGKRTRSAQSDRDDDDELAVDSTVVDMFNHFAKSKRQQKQPSGELIVLLRSSRNNRVQTRSASENVAHPLSELGTIDESPQPGRPNPVSSNPALLEEEEEEVEVEESAPEVDVEAAEDIVQSMENGLNSRGGNETEDDSDSDGLFVRQTPRKPRATKPRASSPELHTVTPHLPPGTRTAGIYNFSDEEEREPEVPPPRPVPRSQPQRAITRSLSTAGGAAQKGPKRVPGPPPNIIALRAEDHDFGYPPTSAQPSRTQASSSASRPQRAAFPRAPSVPSSQASLRGPTRTRRQAALEVVDEVGESEEEEQSEADHEDQEGAEDDQDAQERRHDQTGLGEVPVVITSTSALTLMHRFMGKIGWSNKGKDWYKKLRDNPGAGGAPGLTRVGELLFKYLFRISSLLNSAPKAPLFDRQSRWFAEHKSEVKKSFSEIGKMITKIREDCLAPLGDSDRRGNANLELRAAMVTDLTNYVMPILVHALWTACTLGGTEEGVDNHIVPAEEVNLTETTLPHVRTLTSWVNRLHEALVHEIGLRPPTFADHGKAELAKKQRGLFAKAVTYWEENVQQAEDELEELLSHEDHLARCAENDQAARELREKQEQEEAERARQKMEAVIQSTRWIASQPRPLEQLWRRATAGWDIGSQRSSSSSLDINGKPRPLLAVQFSENRAVIAHPQWPDEDKGWLLAELRRTDRKRGPNNRPAAEEYEEWAGILERPVVEVMQEAEGLRHTARRLAVERGIMVEEWARL